jgi:hypothetical protein
MGRSEENKRGDSSDDGLGPASTAAAEEIIWNFYDLDLAVQRSRRYHEKLAEFYARWRDRIRVVTAIAASGAFLVVVADIKIIEELVTAFVALWAVLDIIMAPDKKSERHAVLQKRFTELAGRIAQASRDKHSLGELIAARLIIEEGEPPCKRLVDLEARNDELRARGYPPDELVPLSQWQRRLGRYFDFDLPRLEEWKAARQRSSAEKAA